MRQRHDTFRWIAALGVFQCFLTAAASAQTIDRVFVIVMENKEYTDVVGSSASPYLNSLIAAYGLAENNSGVAHPSLPNYMAMTGGDTFFTTNCQDCRVDAPNIADRLEASGRTWTAYMEGMTAPCGLVDEGLYVARHNPFVHYRNIAENPARCGRIRPFGEFAGDLQAGTLSNYVWITPDLCHDMHDCGVEAGDQWLQSVVPSIIGSPSFQRALLFIAWDEGTSAAGGGGHIPLVVVSPRTPAGTRSSLPSDHYSLLRTIEDVWGLPPLGRSASARPLTEFLNLLERPGFEEYQPPSLGAPGWIADAFRQTAAFSEAHQPHRGTKNGACWTPSNLDCGMYQVVTAPSTGTYSLTFYATADRPGGIVGASVNATLAASMPVQARGFANYGAPYTMTFNASAGQKIVVWMYSPASPGYVVVDDVSLTPVPVADPGASWNSLDIGDVGLAGSAAYVNGQWTVAGAGTAAVWGRSDAFRFVFQSMSGDGEVTAHVTTLENTTPFAKAGVMMRQGLSADAAHVILNLRPAGEVELMYRSAAGADTVFVAPVSVPNATWVRLTRRGSSIAGALSTDGVGWTTVGTIPSGFVAPVLNAGVIVTSNDSARLNTARFEGVSFVQTYQTSDIGAIGITGNAVALNNGLAALAGGGPTGVWGAADAFRYTYAQATGDHEIVARVTSIQNTNTFAKAGIMIRQSLAPDAPNVILDVRPTGDIEFMQRAVAGGQTTFLGTARVPLPYWLRLTRTGSTVTAAISDGSTWRAVGSTTVAMPATAFFGVIATSVNGSQLNHATFDGVSVR